MGETNQEPSAQETSKRPGNRFRDALIRRDKFVDSSEARCGGRSGFPRQRQIPRPQRRKRSRTSGSRCWKSQSIDSTHWPVARDSRPRARGPPRWVACARSASRSDPRLPGSAITSRVASVLLSSTRDDLVQILSEERLAARSRAGRCSSPRCDRESPRKPRGEALRARRATLSAGSRSEAASGPGPGSNRPGSEPSACSRGGWTDSAAPRPSTGSGASRRSH